LVETTEYCKNEIFFFPVAKVARFNCMELNIHRFQKGNSVFKLW